MQLTTSKRISLSFALYTFCIVFFFGVINNIGFFQQRYRAEMMRLQVVNIPEPVPLRGRFTRPVIQSLAANSELLQLLNENRVLYNISKIDEEYILFVTAGPVVRVAVVTRLVHAQREMLISTVILLCVFAVATYMLALLLVKFSLKPVNKLVEYVDALDIHRLDVPVPLSGPANDEIRKIAQTLQNTLHLLKEQTDSLKDFVSHASHELKTPLMSLSSAVDVAQKTGDYASTFPVLKKTIRSLNSLFDMLLHITQWEHSAIAFENIALKPVLEEVENELSALYAHKNIVCTLDLKDVSVLAQKDVVRSIFFNLIQNAYKYTPEKGTIALFCDAKKFVVTNSGSEIPEAHHAKIRTRFWKDHRGEHQEGFGLGLYLVKLLVTKLNRTVQVSSEQHQTSFTVYFQS